MGERGILAPALVLAAFATAYVAASAFVGPFLGMTDTAAYKDAAANFAQGRGFTMAFGFGNTGPEFLAYAGHPPLYPLLSGVWFTVFGVSPEANAVFETLLRIGLAAGFLSCLLVSLRRPLDQVIAALVVGVGLPAAIAGVPHDRPDAMGLIFVCGSITSFSVRNDRFGAVVASLFAGLALATAPIAGLLAIAALTLIWLTKKTGRLPFFSMSLVGFVGTAAPIAIMGSVIHRIDQTYWHRLGSFILNAGDGDISRNEAGLSLALTMINSPTELLDKLGSTFNTAHHWIHASTLLIVILGVVLWGAVGRGERRARLLVPSFAVATALIVTILFAWNRYYPALAGIVILAAWSVAGAGAANRWVISTLALVVLLNMPIGAMEILARSKAAETIEPVRQYLSMNPVEDINSDGRRYVLLDPAHFLLFRELGYEAAGWGDFPLPAHLATIDAFVFGYGGSGHPLEAKRPPWWPATDVPAKLVHSMSEPRPIEIFGIAVSRSSRTWDMELWQRVN